MWGFGGCFVLVWLGAVCLIVSHLQYKQLKGCGDFKTFLPRPCLARQFRKCGLKLGTLWQAPNQTLLSLRKRGHLQRTAIFTGNGSLSNVAQCLK